MTLNLSSRHHRSVGYSFLLLTYVSKLTLLHTVGMLVSLLISYMVAYTVYGLNCISLTQIHILKSQAPGAKNVTLFGNSATAEVISQDKVSSNVSNRNRVGL